jgi:hypothetical protein
LLGGSDAVTQGAKEFETAVQSGVAALLKVATHKLQNHVERQEKRRDR